MRRAIFSLLADEERSDTAAQWRESIMCTRVCGSTGRTTSAYSLANTGVCEGGSANASVRVFG